MLKKIAFFVGSIISDYPAKTTRAISQNAEGKFSLDVFSSIGAVGESYFHGDNDKRMINIPHLKDYAGIIIEPDSFSGQAVYEELVHKIEREATCPVVSLRYRDNRFYNVLVDDYGAMECMVKHFIEVHNFKKICHMTGRLELADAKLRLKSYQDTMAKYNLPVTDHMIFEGNYWTDRGEAAVEWFLGDGSDCMPEAIVCANDYMALSVADTLKKRGLRVPEDICVSGFDNISEVQYSVPRIASMNVPAEEMGVAAINILERLLNGEAVEQNTYLSVVPCFGGSCGCESQSSVNHTSELLDQISYLNKTLKQLTYMNWDNESCLTYEELISCAFRYSFHFDYEKLYICLCERNETENDDAENMESPEQYTENMVLYSIFSKQDNSYRFCNQVFPRHKILPDEHREDKNAIYVFTLHYKSHCFGYVAIKTKNPEKLARFFILWIQELAGGMDRIYLQHKNKAYFQFMQQSRLDELTGLYNRREMENILRRKKYDIVNASPFYMMSLDMDGLKIINDTYGHLEGDNALRTLAEILKNVSNPNVIAARIGGDEFVLCIMAENDEIPCRVQEDILNRIDAYNQVGSKPYILSASIGYARFSKKDGIIGCMKKADEKMYADKFSKRNTRSNSPDKL